MPVRPTVDTLNASTLDILNTIRQYASYEYQSLVPKITKETEIPKVGEVLMGYPALANQFINSLVNRIALVRVKSATFYNDFKELKKGYVEFGETVEEVFVNLAKVRHYSVEKAAEREFQRTLPDVRTAFHAINWRVQYPVTIQNRDLEQAFLSVDGVQDLIARIVDAIYTAAEYDEYLLFKYLMIKAVTHGKMYPVDAGATTKTAAVAARGYSNLLTRMSTRFNQSGVYNTTPRDDQFMFWDAKWIAEMDVNELAVAFNMDKAQFMGHILMVDDWTTFDFDRFSQIEIETDAFEPITQEELALMASVKGVLCDREWFQFYDNRATFTEKYVSSGEYWNYFYNVWKTVSSSPFSNAIVFVDSTAIVTPPTTVSFKVISKDNSDDATVINLMQVEPTGLSMSNGNFVQTEAATTNMIAIKPYGSIIFPAGQTSAQLEWLLGSTSYQSAKASTGDTPTYTASPLTTSAKVGDTILFAQLS